MGGMSTLGSYNNKNKPLIFDSVLICLIDSSVSLISGFAVWTVIGHMMELQNGNVKDLASIGLVFITYPTAILTFTDS